MPDTFYQLHGWFLSVIGNQSHKTPFPWLFRNNPSWSRKPHAELNWALSWLLGSLSSYRRAVNQENISSFLRKFLSVTEKQSCKTPFPDYMEDSLQKQESSYTTRQSFPDDVDYFSYWQEGSHARHHTAADLLTRITNTGWRHCTVYYRFYIDFIWNIPLVLKFLFFDLE